MTYTIKSGDTLTSIARAYNTTADELARLNGIKDKNMIYAGSTLNIPDGPAGYSKSGDVLQAQKELEEWKTRRPGDFVSRFGDEEKALLAALRDSEFSYDPKSDPAYESYRESYKNAGELAMKDAMGKAASLNGGFSTSYSTQAGQQAFNSYMSRLNDVIPKLYEAAYERYSDTKDSAAEQLKLLKSLDDADWKRYTDMMKSYLDEGKLLESRYENLSEEDFDRFYSLYKLLVSM